MATLLGLMLVVTFISNYLSTTLPNQMAVNDLNHGLLVENELGRLAALLRASSNASVVGGQVIQPIVLGSQGDPPFAGQDGATVAPGARYAAETVNFTLAGPFNPPSIGTPNTGSLGGCSVTSKNGNYTTGISCTGSHSVVWNFSAGNDQVYTVSGNGGLGATVNISTSGSLITIGSVGGAINKVFVLGNNDTVYLNATGGANVTVLLVGSYDSLNFGAKGGSNYHVLLVGNHDTVTDKVTAGGGLLLAGYGIDDGFTGSGSGGFNIYWNGFDLTNATSTKCPYVNGALSDTVAGSPGTVTYNNTNYSHANGTGNASGWTYVYNNPTGSSCPFVVAGGVSQAGILGADFVVNLLNTYAPGGAVAFDEGAVVYAQAGAIPVMLDPPAISFQGGHATVWLPLFENALPSESGTATADLVFRLVALQTQSWPSGDFILPHGGFVVITTLTPYPTAWTTYFSSQGNLTGHFSCSGARNVCSAPYSGSGQLAKVVLSLPATSVTLKVALFAVQLH